MPKCRITVLRRPKADQGLIDEYLADSSKEKGFDACSVYKDGQEFVIEGFPHMPEGFCHWAWADIQRDVATVMFGGDFPWVKQPGTAITCCTDGFRPVVFKVERIEE